ncbi:MULTISPECIES: hypothetical protein [unclassified Streptomyces]|uniref:hypothetical protein n=1 Tax=unclassified Streptomyces TaxID=2593676 RepID=UPI00070CFF8F|nr:MULTISPECIES: hypothetical protein [unclassified Streptomyces]KRC94104.1 hypothetical protein ASE41_38420 [Streptomyces sp. Root264]
MFSEKSSRQLCRVFVALAVVLVIWIFQMGAAPRGHAEVRNWSSSWIGLDILEVLGLLATAILLRARSAYLAPVASAAATLFALDAWFDVMTALAGTDWYIAVGFAAVAEIPLAVTLGAIAIIAPRRVPPENRGVARVHTSRQS